MESRNSRIILILYFLGYIVVFPLLLLSLIRLSPNLSDNHKFLIEAIYYISFLLIIISLAFTELKSGINLIRLKTASIFKSAVVRYFAMLVTLVILNSLIMKFNPAQPNNQVAIDELLAKNRSFVFFLAVIFAPIVEEVVFRGVIFAKLYNNHKVLAFLLSSFLFGFIHVSDSLFMGNFLDFLYIISYSALGFLLCLGYEKYQNISIPIIMHLLNNLVSILLTISFMS